jgi:hypothetical protein
VARRQDFFLFLKRRSLTLSCEDKSPAIVYPAINSLSTRFSISRHGLHGHAKIVRRGAVDELGYFFYAWT